MPEGFNAEDMTEVVDLFRTLQSWRNELAERDFGIREESLEAETATAN